ncbi:PREDICTED: uncharacterized protein LOC105312422 isoform X2 [Amphimedon queenslandica]|uniref:Death domain-containing protein n=1 Tax=Amphimedon queenslandica TaxID=400682 RepID=A0AAN0J2E8_AMPQE|nr:PREDICTED: uncharacterized protein LOC105312422 isoform X2 [Amphimedon queenslandica]|eukprot:XP_019850896.1 PREDICTED: uncharacterized protein LOC105312422 isoform X2 [Amphimedon queenslandica]
MIDVCQWRVSIGLWSYRCQAPSTNGKAVKSKLGILGEKTPKLMPVALPLSLFAFLLTLFFAPTLSNFYQVDLQYRATSGVTDLQSVLSSSFNFIYYLIVCLYILLLSGDIERNPGPMIDARPEISLLIKWLEPLVDWKPFGLCLVGMTEHEILKIEQEHVKIEDRKLALYLKWFSVNPMATWRDVIYALTESDAASIKSSSLPSTLTKSDGDIEIIFFPKEDQTVQDTLDELQVNFSHIMREVKSAFRTKVNKNLQICIEMSNWIESYLHWEHGTLDSDLDHIFKKIYHNYDFIDCCLVVAMCNEFISDEKDLLDKLNTHSLKANAFCSSVPIIELKQKLRKVYGPYRRCLENMPLICIELQNPWNDVKINGLYILVKRLLPKEHRQSIMKYITIEEGSVVIKLDILNLSADSLIEYTEGKLQFMYLIGIFSLCINDYPVLQKNENMNFTFELALLEAVTAGNNEAVEFLLQLKIINIDHTNKEGQTALMLACERRHENIVHSLLSAGANVNIQDNKGWTALIVSSQYSGTSIIHVLLEADANVHLRTSGGSNSLMYASCNGNYEAVELLISKGADYECQRKDGMNAFMLACKKGHINIVELLLKNRVDPNVQRKDSWNAFMLACENGHTQIVEVLLKEPVDPNVQRKSGGNAFMLACQNGHTQIVELLLKEKIDPNVQKNNGWNAFMLACHNGHTQIVQLLLKEQVDPNVQMKDGATALMLACQNGHAQIVELLLKENVEPNVQRDDGVNAIMLACKMGHTQVVELLLKEQVNPDAQNRCGTTALMIASKNGYYEVVKLLLEWKADPNIKSLDGKTALSVAKTNKISVLIDAYLKEFNQKLQLQGDAASAMSEETMTSGYYTTESDISVTSALTAKKPERK